MRKKCRSTVGHESEVFNTRGAGVGATWPTPLVERRGSRARAGVTMGIDAREKEVDDTVIIRTTSKSLQQGRMCCLQGV